MRSLIELLKSPRDRSVRDRFLSIDFLSIRIDRSIDRRRERDRELRTFARSVRAIAHPSASARE